jgi:transcriptional regulator NrdR family protein
MKCPYCGKNNTDVVDSRDSKNGEGIRQMRISDFVGV